MGRWGISLTAVAAALLLAPSAAGAATILVTSPSDSGSGCTLRGAIESANANAELGGCHAGSAGEKDVIEFSLLSGTTIHLEAAALEAIEGKTEIRGPGAGKLTVDAGGAFRVFALEAGAEATIAGLTITGGGGECTAGCGILNPSGSALTLEGARVEGNEAASSSLLGPGEPGIAEGAGIYNAGTMTVALSTVADNAVVADSGELAAKGLGGGISNAGSLTVDRSTVAENSVLASVTGGQSTVAEGGGIANTGTLVVERSTIADNSAEATLGSVEDLAKGGGIGNALAAGAVVIRGSTLTGNSVTAADANPFARGGGIYVDGTSTSIASSTIVANSGAEGANLDLGIHPTVESTIVAGPVGGPNCLGTVISAGFNLESANVCGFGAATDQVEANPGLGTLGANGGPTETIPLLSTSAAIDKGNSPFGETLDQRGLARPVDIASKANAAGGNGGDVGAYEVQVPIAQITSGPLEGATLASANAAFAFKANEAVAEFQCTLDGASLGACTSPKMLSGLADGSHTFGVVAVAQTSGFASAKPTTRTFTVATHPLPEPEPEPQPQPQPQPQSQTQPQPQAQQPAQAQPGSPASKPHPPATTISGLKPKTSSRRLAIRFGSNQAGSTFACSLDHGPFKRCSSPYRTKTLSFGSHSFQVVATNSAGVADPTPASKSFRVLEPAS